jgi:hypothetical protein
MGRIWVELYLYHPIRGELEHGQVSPGQIVSNKKLAPSGYKHFLKVGLK